MQNHGIARYLAKAISTNYVKLAFSIASFLLFLPLAIQLMGMEGYGVIALIWSYSYFSVFFELGIGKSVAINLSRCTALDQRQRLAVNANLLGLFLAAASFFCAMSFLRLVQTHTFSAISLESSASAEWVAAAYLAVTVYLSIQRSILEGLNRIHVVNVGFSVISAANFLFLSITYWVTEDLILAAASTIGLSVGVSIFYMKSTARCLQIKSLCLTHANWKIFRTVIAGSGRISIVGLGTAAIQPLFRIFLIELSPGLQTLAQADIALRMSGFAGSLINSVGTPFLSIFGRMGRTHANTIALYANRATIASLVVMLIGVIVYYFSIDMIYTAMTGNKGMGFNTSILFATILVGPCLNALFEAHFRAMLALERLNELIYIRLLQGVIFLGFASSAAISENVLLLAIAFSLSIAIGGILTFTTMNLRTVNEL